MISMIIIVFVHQVISTKSSYISHMCPWNQDSLATDVRQTSMIVMKIVVLLMEIVLILYKILDVIASQDLKETGKRFTFEQSSIIFCILDVS